MNKLSQALLIVALGVSTTLAGCAGAPPYSTYDAPVTGCCAKLSELPFHPMQLGVEVDFTLSPNEPTYDFSGERKHVVAVKIPDGFQATTIQVRSYIPFTLPPQSSTVVPEFTYLGSDFKVIETSFATGFQPSQGFWRSSVVGRAHVPETARYILVTAGSGKNGLPIIHSGGGFTRSIRAAALGDFSLRLFGEHSNK